MMIPKVINYCWFGGNKLPDEFQKYMASWRKYCPEYEIKKWDENNFDVYANQYCREAYKAQKWAFVSDYARLWIIYNYGGVYLDTDVEVLKPLDSLVSAGVGFIGFQNTEEVTTGLGFAAAPGNSVVKAMLDIYETRKFVLPDGNLNLVPCPAANTVALLDCGLKTGRQWSNTIQHLDGIDVFPVNYFNPLNRDTGELCISDNTFTVHRYAATWIGKSDFKNIVKGFLPKWYLKRHTERIARRDIEKIRQEVKGSWREK